MRFLLAILLLGTPPDWCQIRDAVKSAQIEKMFASTTQSLEVLAKTNYAVEFRVGSGGPGAPQTDTDADEFWFVRHGNARVSVDDRHYDVNAGDVVSVPRTSSSRITPSAGRFEYVAVRIFGKERSTRIGIGAAPEPHPMPDVVAKAQIDATLSSANKNVLLHSAGTVLINHVIYAGAPGPWEVHQTCDDLYFVRMGTARAELDGTLIHGKEDPLGEIRGTGVTGARSFHIVQATWWWFRATPHTTWTQDLPGSVICLLRSAIDRAASDPQRYSLQKPGCEVQAQRSGDI